MVDVHRQKIRPSISVLLDVLRIAAAAVVLVFHATSIWTTAYPGLHEALGKASHAAVVVFFVISGYVIASTTARNNRGPRQYAVARLSRLYSVMGPALLLTAAIEYVVVHADAAVAARYVRDYSGVRYLLSLLFCNEAGFISAAPPINSPLWSLSYEFWYYTLFGIWFYRKSTRKAGLWLAVAAVLAGPKILLLLPIWLFGVGACRWPGPAVGVGRAWVGVGLLLVLAGLAVAYLPAWPLTVGDKPLFMTGQFATDWVVGALVALAIWCVPADEVSVPGAWVKPLRTVADLAFPLYVLHFPLLVLGRVLVVWRVNDLVQMGLVMAGVIVLAVIAGVALERQRSRWIRFFAWGIGLFSPTMLPVASKPPA